MSPPKLDLPALYDSADRGASISQRGFLWTIRIEYALLIIVSAASSMRDLLDLSTLIISIILIILSGLFVFKIVKRLDQDWYRCRALAESVKTSAWRFSMRAHPFEDADSIDIPRALFRNSLREILKSNKQLAKNLQTVSADEVTESMIYVRGLSLKDRISYYVKYRIDDQRSWYTKKSAYNKKSLFYWVVFVVIIYILSFLSLNADRFGFGVAAMAFDPLIVLVTSIIGWVQIKRHSELVASYNLAAHEIGIIRINSDSISTEEKFSNFVNEAELAFSREHTQWAARRDVV